MSTSPRVYYLPNHGMMAYANKTEPNLYPHGFTELVTKDHYDSALNKISGLSDDIRIYLNENDKLEERNAELQKQVEELLRQRKDDWREYKGRTFEKLSKERDKFKVHADNLAAAIDYCKEEFKRDDTANSILAVIEQRLSCATDDYKKFRGENHE